jgi:predicted HicB family RNase H-like nuclease
MTNNVLNYLKAKASINFDAELMMFVGEVDAAP